MVAYNFFLFGLVFNGSASLQAALLNPINKISVSSTFTVLGIMCLVLSFADSIYSLKESPLYFFKLRVFVKAILLSSCYNSPLYLFCAAFIADILLMIIEFRLSREQKPHPKLWVFNNVFADLALLLLVFIHSHYVTLIFASLMVLIIVVIEFYVHYKDYQAQKKSNRFLTNREYKLRENSEFEDIQNIWNINFNEEKGF